MRPPSASLLLPVGSPINGPTFYSEQRATSRSGGCFFIFFPCSTADCRYIPEFERPLANLTVTVGHEAVLTCHVNHLGGYKVGWIKSDTKAIQAIHTHVITHNPRVSVRHHGLTIW